MAKNIPVHVMRGTEAPPVVNGYWDHGTVWSPDMPSRREPMSHVLRVALWSLAYWGRKVRRGIQEVPSTTRAMRAADRVMLALVATVTWAHERAGSPKE